MIGDRTALAGRLRSHWSSIVAPSIGSLGAALVSQLALLVSGVVSARVLGPEDRGHVAFLILISSVMSMLSRLGTNASVTYYVAREPGSTRSILSALKVPMMVQGAICLTGQIGLLLWVLQDIGSDVGIAARISLILGISSMVSAYGLAVLQGLRIFRLYNSLRVFSVVSTAVVLVLALPIGLSVTLVLAIYAFTSVLASIVIVVAVSRVIPENSSDTPPIASREILSFGAKGFLGSSSPVDTFRLDQMIVGLFLTPAALGIYVSAVSFTSLPKFIAQSLSSVALPTIAHRGNRRDGLKLLWVFFFVVTAVNMVIALIIGIMSESIVVGLFGSEFRESAPIVRILLLAAVLVGSRRVVSEGLRALGMPGVGSMAEVISWITLVPAMVFLAPVWGLHGIAYSILLASITSFAMVILRTRLRL